MRISTAMAHQQGTNAILDQQTKLQHTQIQLSTGKRVVTPADDPVASTLALELEQIDRRNEQFDMNANFAENRMWFAESTLSNMQETLQRIRELAIQSLNDSLEDDSRTAISAELRERFDELLRLANSSDGSGDYIFAGFNTDTPPFDGNISAGVNYVGDQGQLEIQIAPGRSLAATESGAKIFGKLDDGSGGHSDMFSMVGQFIADLESNTHTGVILDQLDASMNSIGEARARFGARLSALDEQRNINESYSVDLQRAKSELLDLDYAEAVSRLNIQMAGFQAAQQTVAKVNQLSLFNFL